MTVTLQPVDELCDEVPPGHSAESNTPPLLLLTVKVKLRLPQVQRALAPHTLLWQSLAPPQTLPRPHPGQLVPPQSTSVSVPFFSPSVQLGA